MKLILDIRYNVEDSMLITKIHPREDTLFQCWNLPNLDLVYEVTVPTTVSDYALIGNAFLCGHSTGSVQLHELKVRDPSSQNKVSHASVSDLSDVSSVHSNGTQDVTGSGRKKREHQAPVIAVDACHQLQLFVTCSSDGMIKLWDSSKTLQTEVILDTSLSTVGFLNKKGDLLVGFRNHIFFIDHSKVNPSHAGMLEDVQDDAFETESDIYEDPAVRYEGAAANPDPIDMKNYLVPFELDFTGNFLDKSPTSPTNSIQEEDEDSDDSDLSMAPTDIYLSPLGTPRRLSRVDMLMSPDFSVKDIAKRAAVYKKKSKSSRIAFHSPDSGLDFEMPIFGESPGPSPVSSTPSTPTDLTSQEESEIEELEEDEINDESTFTPIETPEVSTPALIVNIPEVKTPDSETQGKSRFDLSKYKIDAKALIKTNKRSANKVDPPTQMEQLASMEETTVQKRIGSGRVIQKKQMKSDRTRVTRKTKAAEQSEDSPSEAVPPQQELEPQSEPASQKASPFMVSKKQPVKKESQPPQPQQPKKAAVSVSKPPPKKASQPSKVSASSTMLMLKPDVNANVGRSGVKPGKTLKKTKKTSIFQNYPLSKPTVSVSPTADMEDGDSDKEEDNKTSLDVADVKEVKSDSVVTYGLDVATDIGQVAMKWTN
ncbi:uncharacterized protein LOC144449243 [Glandiceps talaboti]